MATTLPSTLEQLADRYDPSVFELTRSSARVRLAGAGSEPVDAVVDGEGAALARGRDGRPDALLSADARTWAQIARDVRGGMDAFRSGRLRVRYDLHLGVGFLAATADSGDHGLRFSQLQTREGAISLSQAGSGPPVVMVHGLGATKVSVLPTAAAFAGSHRAIASAPPGS